MADQPQQTPPPTLNELDDQLLSLVLKRAEFVRDNPLSEVELVANPTCQAAFSALGIESHRLDEFRKHLENLCLQSLPDPTTVAYLGPKYSYSYLAAVKHFGQGVSLNPVANIEAAFEEVTRKQSTFAVVPIENSNDGRVVDTLGMFARTPAQICGEVDLPIHHCLLGIGSRAEIQQVHSKPQALSQCRGWLATHLPHAELVEARSTASAAALASQSAAVGAIASEEAGIHYRLKMIDRHIEDHEHNVTRFVIIGNEEPAPTGTDKTTLMFQLEHQPGALANAMVAFQNANINLTWIESFPMPNCPSEYLFFVELVGHREDEHVKAALQNLTEHTRRLDVLGSFAK